MLEFNFIEILMVVGFAYLYYKSQKPALKYLFLGGAFFFIAMLIQIPFRYLEITLKESLGFVFSSQILVAPFLIAVTELTKYFSMKRFLKTRSFKNGMFFGIGWISIESINFFTAGFFSLFFSMFAIQFDISSFLNPNYGALNFMFFFILNLAITTFVVRAIVKKNLTYLIFAIVFSLFAYYGLLLFNDIAKYLFSLFLLMFSTLVVFRNDVFK